MTTSRVYLVPGFFGFTSLGSLSYFHPGVTEALATKLSQRSLGAEVVECPTQPAGGILRRVERLRRHVLATGGLEADQLHFVCHSTGGLDLRVLLSPGVHTGYSGEVEALDGAIAERTRSVITIATPHHGTPIATLFATVQGQHVLKMLPRALTTRPGRAAVVLAAKALAALARLDDPVGRRTTLMDRLASQLLRDLTWKSEDPVWRFLNDLSADQGALIQLTPESLDLFNAVVVDRPGVAYSSVVAVAPPPGLRLALRNLKTPSRLVSSALFATLHGIASRVHSQYPYPAPAPLEQEILDHEVPFAVTARSSDGLVPAWSQLHGRLLRVVVADHLDVVGQFHRDGDPLSDWLRSGAAFDEASLEDLWSAVAVEIGMASLGCREDIVELERTGVGVKGRGVRPECYDEARDGAML